MIGDLIFSPRKLHKKTHRPSSRRHGSRRMPCVHPKFQTSHRLALILHRIFKPFSFSRLFIMHRPDLHINQLDCNPTFVYTYEPSSLISFYGIPSLPYLNTLGRKKSGRPAVAARVQPDRPRLRKCEA